MPINERATDKINSHLMGINKAFFVCVLPQKCESKLFKWLGFQIFYDLFHFNPLISTKLAWSLKVLLAKI